MDIDAEVKDALRAYDRNLVEYRLLRDALESEIPLHLRQWGVSDFRVEARVKKRGSFEQKVRRDPSKAVLDMVGVRVMTFFRSDLAQVEKMIRRLFEVVEESYIDKGDLLGDESFGYRSVQFVARTRDGSVVRRDLRGNPGRDPDPHDARSTSGRRSSTTSATSPCWNRRTPRSTGASR